MDPCDNENKDPYSTNKGFNNKQLSNYNKELCDPSRLQRLSENPTWPTLKLDTVNNKLEPFLPPALPALCKTRIKTLTMSHPNTPRKSKLTTPPATQEFTTPRSRSSSKILESTSNPLPLTPPTTQHLTDTTPKNKPTRQPTTTPPRISPPREVSPSANISPAVAPWCLHSGTLTTLSDDEATDIDDEHSPHSPIPTELPGFFGFKRLTAYPAYASPLPKRKLLADFDGNAQPPKRLCSGLDESIYLPLGTPTSQNNMFRSWKDVAARHLIATGCAHEIFEPGWVHRDVTPIEQLRKEYRAKQPAPKRVLTNEEVGRTKAWKKYNQMMEDTANHGDVLYTEDGKMMILEKGFGPGVQKVVMYPGF